MTIARHLVDVHLLLVREARVLLSLRRSGDEYDGRWHLPSGKLEHGESATAGLARETWEETGIRLDPARVRLVHVAHVTAPAREPRLGLFFRADTWTGTPDNREPDKCYALRWFPLADLPDNLIDYSATGIHALSHPSEYSEAGW
ncbi:NUDIX hydrolase [Nocardia thailandica]